MSSYSYDGKVPVIIFRIRGGEGGLEDFGGSHGFHDTTVTQRFMAIALTKGQRSKR